MYADKSIRTYLDDLASNKPAPGGGSAAALEAAMGCALMSMVANFTISNKRYSSVRDKAGAWLAGSERMRKRLLKLADDDVNSYGRLSAAMKDFKNEPSKLEACYKEACGVPFEVLGIASEALGLLTEVAEYGNKNLITDTAIAALMLESGFYGARFNVYINLKYINDKNYVENVHKTVFDAEEAAARLKKEVLERCEEVIIE